MPSTLARHPATPRQEVSPKGTEHFSLLSSSLSNRPFLLLEHIEAEAHTRTLAGGRMGKRNTQTMTELLRKFVLLLNKMPML